MGYCVSCDTCVPWTCACGTEWCSWFQDLFDVHQSGEPSIWLTPAAGAILAAPEEERP